MQETVPKLLKFQALKNPDLAAQRAKDDDGVFQSVSYKEMLSLCLDFGAGLLDIGVSRGEKVAIVSDNRKEWMQADIGLLAIGAVDVPRGCDATDEDLSYIAGSCKCRFAILENPRIIERFLSFRDKIPALEKVICIDDCDEEMRKKSAKAGISISSFGEILHQGTAFRSKNAGVVEAELEKGTADDVATVIFTSGTTGVPKGVVLTHRNFMSQLDDLCRRISLKAGDCGLSVLPVWHAFERECEYVLLSHAASICYSSPIGKVLLADLQKIRPHVFQFVPRILEAVYDGVFRQMRKTGGAKNAVFKFLVKAAECFSRFDRRIFCRGAMFSQPKFARFLLIFPWAALWPLHKIAYSLIGGQLREKFGGRLRGGVSGGGALPPQIDEFFWSMGVNIVEGYGLTETAPVIATRPFANPIFGTVGRPLSCLKVKIVGEKGEILPPGKIGTLLVKGDSVMCGYYENSAKTAEVLSNDGWFDTGDMATMTIHGEIALRGRKKDTIVLRGGENIEPKAIEMRLLHSPYIMQAVVVGCDENLVDQRTLAALIVPSKSDVTAFAKSQNIEYSSYSELLNSEEIVALFRSELNREISSKHGFRPFERIADFRLIEKPFEVGRELSVKMDLRRFKIPEYYATELHEIYNG